MVLLMYLQNQIKIENETIKDKLKGEIPKIRVNKDL
jgi:hypothetical protein